MLRISVGRSNNLNKPVERFDVAHSNLNNWWIAQRFTVRRFRFQNCDATFAINYATDPCAHRLVFNLPLPVRLLQRECEAPRLSNHLFV